jgi:hypothetical protein
MPRPGSDFRVPACQRPICLAVGIHVSVPASFHLLAACRPPCSTTIGDGNFGAGADILGYSVGGELTAPTGLLHRS